jgi:prolipoprotein diacylglyceryltransferase
MKDINYQKQLLLEKNNAMAGKLYVSFLGRRIRSFHFFGVSGYILGTILGVVLAIQSELLPSVILLLAGAGAGTFFALAFLAKQITGEEKIVYYHHEISIIIVCTLALYLLKLPVLPYLDITLLGIGTFLAFGRIGCYSVGCCHGRPHKHGVSYGQAHVDEGFTWFYKDVPVLPVQLIESTYVSLTVIAGIILLLNHVAPGTVLIVYTVVYGLMRFTLEFFRGDPDRPHWQGLSEAQWTTIILTAATFSMSKMKLLPEYSWHWVILSVMAIASAITVYYFHRYPEHKLFSPMHVKQIAEGLQKLEDANANPQINQERIINVYNTNLGLSVSCSQLSTGAILRYYTVSFKDKAALQLQSADKIAKLISILDKQPEKYDIIDKQNGIYHILFKENEIVI